MKNLLAVWILCVIGLDAMPCQGTDAFSPGNFFVGCNYWGSKAGVRMWREQDWDEQEIEKDIAALAATGVEVMRVFPTWSEFQPLVQNKMYAGIPGEYLIEGLDKPVYDPLWVEPGALARFRTFCDIADKHGVKLMVSLVTGWMSGRLFTPRMVEGKNLITDPEALMLEGRFARGFVRKMKDHSAIVAWDLGNECNCMGKVESAAQAWNWLNTISSAIRLEDSTRPVVSGMHSQTSNGYGAQRDKRNDWNLQMQGELLDVLTPHPYPASWRVDANRGPFNGFRNALHPVSQCLFYSGVAGKPAFPQEIGSFGPRIYPDELAAIGIRQQLWTNWQHGMNGYLWWCAFDQMHLGYAPFSNNAMERELGMMKADAARTPKPQARALKAFQDVRRMLPFTRLPPHRTDAVCLVSEKEEFYHQTAGSLLLAKQAGFDIRFVGAESQALPEASFYIVPSGSGWETYSQTAWERIVDRVRAGATLLVTRGAAAGYSDWTAVTGTELMLYRENHGINFELDGKPLKASDGFQAKLTAAGCDVVASDRTGNIVLSKHGLGSGKVLVVNFELERLAFAALPNVFEGDLSNELWRIYAWAAREAGVNRIVTRADSQLVLTEHPQAAGPTLVVAVNTRDAAVACPVAVKGRVGRIWNGTLADGVLRLGANDGCVFEVEEN